ncbi:ABC transporter ATP-binding protein [Brevibacillus sp. SYSU BS000544]|uniref:ABC transporter ATP-binding protein n=1 Tax=Brevibacillus sp. SYSU BS000544 TaxID=3416443 RepID=UPI003CE553AD
MVTSIRLNNIKKVYTGDGVVTNALYGINIHFHQGEFTAIVGPSGSGKSSLLNLIGTLDNPTEGNILYGQEDLSRLHGSQLADFRFQHIGFVFQQFHLLPTLTSLENIMAPLLPRRVPYNKRVRAEELLKWVGLEHKKNALPSQLSGGEQQRVAIARALVNEPKWLLADEPTGNLDTNNSELICKLLRRFQQEKGAGIILITHDLRIAEQADRIVRMRDGEIVEDSRGGNYH